MSSSTPLYVAPPWADIVAASIYDEHGRIRKTGTYQRILLDEMVGDLLVLEGVQANLLTDYVRDGATYLRPANPAYLDGLVLRDLPVPCTVWVDNTEYSCDESIAELSLPPGGRYRVVVEAFPYLDKEWQIEN